VEERIAEKETWEDHFALMHKRHADHLGSSGWNVAPSTVKTFIKGIIAEAERRERERVLKNVEEEFERAQREYNEGRIWPSEIYKKFALKIQELKKV